MRLPSIEKNCCTDTIVKAKYRKDGGGGGGGGVGGGGDGKGRPGANDAFWRSMFNKRWLMGATRVRAACVSFVKSGC